MTAPWNGRPPAPLDEALGWHSFYDLDIGITCQQWCPESGIWMARSGRWMTPDDITDGEYYGVVLTPDQIAAQIAEAVKAEREACAEACFAIFLQSRQFRTFGMDQVAEGAKLRSVVIRARGETA